MQGNRILSVGAEPRVREAAGPGAEVVDVAGATVLPGLIDSHCHVTFDEPQSNDELFFHRRAGLGALVASVNAQKVLRAGLPASLMPIVFLMLVLTFETP